MIVFKDFRASVRATLALWWCVQTLMQLLTHTGSNETRLGADSDTEKDFSSLFNGVVSVSLETRWTVM